jgi:hypothetical protein
MAQPRHLEAVKAVVGVFARDVVGAYLAGPQAAADGGHGRQLRCGGGGCIARVLREQGHSKHVGARVWRASEGRQAATGALRPGLTRPRVVCGWRLTPLPACCTPLSPRRLSASVQELLGAAAAAGSSQPAQEAGVAADSGSPCGSSASGEWRQAAAPPLPAAPSDVDSDVVLRPQDASAAAAKDGGGGGDASARSHDSGAWAVGTPSPAGEAAGGAAAAPPRRPSLPQLRRVQAAAAEGPSLSREGSGNLEWISVVGKEWLNVSVPPPLCCAAACACLQLAACAEMPATRKARCRPHSRTWCPCAIPLHP